MKGWGDKIAELSLRGRVRDTFDKAERAREWNGNDGLGNVEFVKVTSGGVESRHAPTEPGKSVAKGPIDRPRSTKGSEPCKLDGAGVAPGPLTIDSRGTPPLGLTINAGVPTRKDGPVRPAIAQLPTPAPIPKTAPGKPVTSLYPLVTICRSVRIAEPIPEYRFHPTRKWRADYCWPTRMLMLEVEGGLWTNGRHSRGKGAIADLEKYSEAAIMGYRVIYCTPDELHNGVALDRIIRALTDREAA